MFEGRCVNTIVRSRPMRRRGGTAIWNDERLDEADREEDERERRCDVPNFSANQYAMKDWMTKPPPKLSRAKSAESRMTMPLRAVEWRHGSVAARAAELDRRGETCRGDERERRGDRVGEQPPESVDARGKNAVSAPSDPATVATVLYVPKSLVGSVPPQRAGASPARAT